VTLYDLLRDGAARAPDQAVVVTHNRSHSYADRLARCDAISRGLKARSIERFACVVTDTADLLSVLCASAAVGSEACIFQAQLDEATIDSYLSTFAQPIVVSDRPLQINRAEVLPPEALAVEDGPVPEPTGSAPTLILTTGTTGRPKGVRHDWSRLVAATRRPEHVPGARWLLAYNINQFAGIQVLLHVLASRATLVVPTTNQPRDALTAMREFGVTHVSATPTFWRFVTALLDDETDAGLPLQQITLGGEASPGTLLDKLARLFPRTRISHIYAGTEFGSIASVRDGTKGLPLSVLDRDDQADSQLRIVDGELQIRSRVGMLGYYGEADVDEGWRPTGDLVEVRDDRIVFVGRTTDTINVGGVKVHPLPVEELVGAVDGVELVRAYGRPSPLTGEIVALDVVARPGVDRDDLERDIRAACDSLVAAARPRRIRFVEDIDVKGQKIDRGVRPT
jgi:acyl-CoA synthetase (AMP-forming)/AMP-acid ligase II